VASEEAQRRGRGSRKKGQNGELELARIFRDQYGYDVHRGYTFHNESDCVGLDGIHIEVKRREKISIYEWMEQAIEEAKKRMDGLPVVFFRKNRKEWLVTMQLETFVEMYEAWREEK
jgi:Holliday junction resolvase